MGTNKAEELAKEEYPSIIGTTSTGVGYNMNEREQQAFIKGYNSRQSEIAELTKDKEWHQEKHSEIINEKVQLHLQIVELTKEVERLRNDQEEQLRKAWKEGALNDSWFNKWIEEKYK